MSLSICSCVLAETLVVVGVFGVLVFSSSLGNCFHKIVYHLDGWYCNDFTLTVVKV